MKIFLKIIIILFMVAQIIFGSGLVTHVAQYNDVLSYYQSNYSPGDPEYKVYEVMNLFPSYAKFGMTMPDMQYVNVLKPGLIDIINDFEINQSNQIWYINEVPDADDPNIGVLSFGMDTHNFQYAFQFAEYLLNQAILDDPPGPDPGASGDPLDDPARGMKIALALGYYLHLCQDIIAHNYWVPKLIATTNLGELSLLEPKDTGTELDLIPGIQSHYAIESMHDYRQGSSAAQNIRSLMYSDFWSSSSHIMRPGFAGWVNGVYFDGELYIGRNPALLFFYEVLEDWLTNNPYNLPSDYKTGPLISQNGFFAEVEMFQLMNSFYPAILGHENFTDAMLDWAEFRSNLPSSTVRSMLGEVFDFLIGWTIEDLVRDMVLDLAKPQIQHSAAFGFQTFLGLMINDPNAANTLAYEADNPINPNEYERLKLNPVFTNSTYFSNFSYYQDLGIYYFDVVGPGGYIYTDWSPEYYYSYYWGLVNSLNGNSPALDQRFDIGVYDSYFLVNGERFGPGVEVLPINQCSFIAVAELFAMEEMNTDLSILIKIKLDHNSNMPANDPVIKTHTTTMRQNPYDYNSVQRKKIELSFDNNDFSGINLDDYRGIYFELYIDPNKSFYSTDWKFYDEVVNFIGDNFRYQMYTSYSMAPYSYPTNYISFKFTNLNNDPTNIGGTINVDGEDVTSGENKTLTLGAASTAKATEKINYNSIDYKHNNWNDYNEIYYLQNSFDVSTTNIWHQQAIFEETNSINFITNLNTIEPLQIQDPWYVEESGPNTGQQLSIFHQVESSEYQDIFSDQGLTAQGQWVFPYYSVRAATACATIDGIYEFSHWDEDPNNYVTFENANDLQTGVTFHQTGANVKAMYQAVNSIPNYTVTVPQGEELTIPAGANIQCAEGFTIEVEGSLVAEGTKEQPIILTSSGKLSSFDPHDIDYINLDSQSFIKASGAGANIQMQHVIISNAKYGLHLNNNNSTIEIKNVEIQNSNMGILINKPEDNIIILKNLYLYDNDCGLSFGNSLADENQESVIIIDRSVFTNSNDFAIHFRPNVQGAMSPGIISETILNVLNCTFWNNSQGISFTQTGTTNNGFIYTDIVNTIFEQSHCSFGPNFTLRTHDSNVYYNSGTMPTSLADILTDPYLIDPSNGNFHIAGNSPCIDAGYGEWDVPEYDVYVTPEFDIDGTLPDIGVYFYPQMQGTISEDMTLGGEIKIVNYLTIADGVTLNIEENSTVFVNAGKRLNVYGSLNAQGTSADNIIFTSSDPNNTSPTYWYGIYGISADNLNMSHCQIEGARYGSYVKYEPALFDNVLFETCDTGLKFYYADNSNVTNSEFNNCGNAVTYSHSTTHLNNNTIENCDYGIWSIRGYGNITENSLSNNNYDGLYLTDMSSLQLTTQSDGEKFPINNVIENNSRYGVYISSNSNPNLGTYAEMKDNISGGFNEFNHYEGDYDIYSLNESIIKAEVNYWPGEMNNNGFIDVNPTADDLSKTTMAKIIGLSKITSIDSLEKIISTADSLVANGNYRDAIVLYKGVISVEPDKKISIKALIRIVSCFKETNELNNLLLELDDTYNDFISNKVGTAALDNSVTIYSLLGNYTEALTRIETVINVYLADPDMVEEAAAALYQQAMIYETMALLNPGLGKDALLASKNLNLKTIVEEYPNTDIAKYLILFDGYEGLFVQTDLIPEEFELNPAYPNPFNSTVNFQFGLKEDANVDFIIFDILGRKVWEYKTSNKMEAGYHNIRWNGTNDVGNAVASGLYLVKFKANNFIASQKIILVK